MDSDDADDENDIREIEHEEESDGLHTQKKRKTGIYNFLIILYHSSSL